MGIPTIARKSAPPLPADEGSSGVDSAEPLATIRFLSQLTITVASLMTGDSESAPESGLSNSNTDSNRTPVSEARPRGRLVSEGVLTGHYREGRRFTPRIMAMPGSMANEWVRDDLPDLLWPLCLVALHGDRGIVYYREFQELVIDVVGQDRIDELNIAVDGRLTSLERIPVETRKDIVEVLRGHHRFGELLTEEVLGVMRMYEDLPGQWLLVDPWTHDEDDREESMNWLARSIVAVVGDRHLNALVKASTFGWRLLSRRVHFPSKFGEVLIDYPVNEERRDAADAMILSSFLAFKAMDVQADPRTGEQREAWASRFWNANRELSACVPAGEVPDTDEAEDDEPTDDAGDTPDDSESGEEVAAAGDRTDEPDTSSIRIGDLVDNYMSRLASIAGAFSEAFYDPDLALNLHKPARSEVLAGLATRAIRGVAAVVRAPHMWTGENGANVMRMLFETRVVLLWLLAQDDESIFEQYQDYGRGKRKLHKHHVEAVAQDLGDSTPDEVMSVLGMLETRTGGEWAEEFQAVSVESTFSGKHLRIMAEEVGELDSYNHLFQTSSGVTHGEWWALEDYALQRCVNPLHRFHFVPDFDFREPPPDPRFPGLLLGHLEEIVSIVARGLVQGERPHDPSP